MRRTFAPFYGKRFIGNNNPGHMEVHDLDKETQSCQIDIIELHHIVIFSPDTLEEAKKNRFDNCVYCIGNSQK